MFMGKFTISMVILQFVMLNYQRVMMVNEALHIYLDDLFLTCDVTRFLLDSGHDSPISIAIFRLVI